MTGRKVRVLLLLLLLGASACSTWQADYLKDQVHKATEQDVTARLGKPTEVKQLDDGGTEWLYHVFSTGLFDFGYKGQPAEQICKEYVLTFNERRILTYWIAQDCE